jgi:hypothetical protein
MTPAVPDWKFWHPLPLWQVFVIGVVTQLVIVVPVEMLNGGLKLGIPIWIPSGIAGVVMYLAIRKFAQRKLAAEAGSPR